MASTITTFSHLQIPLKDLLDATNNFDDKNVIGQGGLGKVYKGRLMRSGKLVKIAARRLDSKHKQGIEFWTEISALSSLKHENIVSMIGFCDEKDEKVIINSHEAKGSLSMYLSKPTLTWVQRLKICVGVARALSYIHYEDGRSYSVIHRNINSSTILLDNNFEPKLSGFEYSITHPVQRMDQVLLSQAIGTSGYMDPAVEKTGGVTHKSDIYSFGIVLWEIVYGRKAFIPDQFDRFLAPLVRFHYESNTLNDIIQLGLWNQMDLKSLKSFSKAAYSCLKDDRVQRPDMNYIVHKLEKALELQLPFENFRNNLEHLKFERSHLKIRLADIMLATDNFSAAYHVDETPMYDLYVAELEHLDTENFASLEEKNTRELPKRRNTVVIKRIRPRESNKRGEELFFTEIEMLTTCKHRNIVALLGFCDEGFEMILVIEHVFNGYLSNYLINTKDKPILSWTQRLKICLDVANGLKYLHHEMEDQKTVINRNIRSSTIALDEKWGAKIVDFVISVFLPPNLDDDAFHPISIVGNHLFMDPEYSKTGCLKRESDVYSFGIVMFEILFGKIAHDPNYYLKSDDGLASVARRCFQDGTVNEMIDPIIKEEKSENILSLTKGPNKHSLDIFVKIAYECLAQTQDQRPSIKVVVKELEKALAFQEDQVQGQDIDQVVNDFAESLELAHQNPVNNKDTLRISLEDIKFATNNFHDSNCVGGGGFGKVYKGKLPQGDNTIVAKRLDTRGGQGEQEFRNELQILFEYKHKNIISLVGYCDDKDTKIIVYEYASRGSLDIYLRNTHLTWIKRLNICIDVATALDFLHRGVGTQATVIHRDIKTANILLNDEWNAKLGDFGLSLISSINKENDFVIDRACGTQGYVDPLYLKSRFLTKESDIYSFGVVLVEILCGGSMFVRNKQGSVCLPSFIKPNFDKEKLDEVVFKEIKAQIMPEALTTFQTIACKCIHYNREERPKAKEVLEQLKKALELQVSSDLQINGKQQ